MCFSKHNLGHFFFAKSMFTFVKNGVFFSIDSKKGDCEVCLFDKNASWYATRNTRRPVHKTAYPVPKRGDFSGLMTIREIFFIGRALSFSRR